MTELLDIINSMLVYVFEIIRNFIAPYIYIIMVLVAVGIAVRVVFYIASIPGSSRR